MFGPATRLTIHVKQPETEHTVSVGKLQNWFNGGGNSPMEQVRRTPFARFVVISICLFFGSRRAALFPASVHSGPGALTALRSASAANQHCSG
jgi:hypothetical protein